jgi:hypothetical protein
VIACRERLDQCAPDESVRTADEDLHGRVHRRQLISDST